MKPELRTRQVTEQRAVTVRHPVDSFRRRRGRSKRLCRGQTPPPGLQATCRHRAFALGSCLV